jgi:hypothetical protein
MVLRRPARPRRRSWLSSDPGLRRFGSTKSSKKSYTKGLSIKPFNIATKHWRQTRNGMSQHDRMRQISLYLLCWEGGRAGPLCPRMPALHFQVRGRLLSIPRCQNFVRPMEEGLCLPIVESLRLFIRDQVLCNRAKGPLAQSPTRSARRIFPHPRGS